MRYLLTVLPLLLLAPMVFGQIKTQLIEYRDGDAVLEGYLAYDSTIDGERPGVLVVHAWTGIDDFTRMRTEQLAGLGYIAFAADIYGKGIRPQNAQEASKQASIYRSDRQLMRRRVNAGLEVLRAHELSDDSRLAAIGYCFGGGVALELARSGANIAGVVSFHGNLDTPNPKDAKNIKGKILVQHGADDPNVPVEQVLAFRDEMDNAGVDWYMIWYGHAVHSFTNPKSGDDPSKGSAYNAAADRRSWQAMKDFFNEIFR